MKIFNYPTQRNVWAILATVLSLLVACDDEINVNTGSADPVLNIDAWINDKPEAQTIYLTTTQDYFDNDDLPPAVSGASVHVTDNTGNSYEFVEDMETRDGAYRWYPSLFGEVLVKTGLTYTLKVVVNEETYTSISTAGRVPEIDSITFSFEEGDGIMEDEYRAEFWAADPEGAGDTYWIKTYKNETLLNKTSEINIAYDAGLSAGNFDGTTFIAPVRMGINANDEDEDGQRKSPLSPGDSIYVEIHSLTEASFNYMNEVITQTDRNGGLSELFSSTPLANVSTNITNANGTSVVGFFNVATTSGLGKKFY